MTTAQLNLSEAEVKLIEAKNNVYNARIDLNNAMYLDSQPNFDINNGSQTFEYILSPILSFNHFSAF